MKPGMSLLEFAVAFLCGAIIGLLFGAAFQASGIFLSVRDDGFYEQGDRRIVGRVEEKEWPE